MLISFACIAESWRGLKIWCEFPLEFPGKYVFSGTWTFMESFGFLRAIWRLEVLSGGRLLWLYICGWA